MDSEEACMRACYGQDSWTTEEGHESARKSHPQMLASMPAFGRLTLIVSR